MSTLIKQVSEGDAADAARKFDKAVGCVHAFYAGVQTSLRYPWAHWRTEMFSGGAGLFDSKVALRADMEVSIYYCQPTGQGDRGYYQDLLAPYWLERIEDAEGKTIASPLNQREHCVAKFNRLNPKAYVKLTLLAHFIPRCSNINASGDDEILFLMDAKAPLHRNAAPTELLAKRVLVPLDIALDYEFMTAVGYHYASLFGPD